MALRDWLPNIVSLSEAEPPLNTVACLHDGRGDGRGTAWVGPAETGGSHGLAVDIRNVDRAANPELRLALAAQPRWRCGAGFAPVSVCKSGRSRDWGSMADGGWDLHEGTQCCHMNAVRSAAWIRSGGDQIGVAEKRNAA